MTSKIRRVVALAMSGVMCVWASEARARAVPGQPEQHAEAPRVVRPDRVDLARAYQRLEWAADARRDEAWRRDQVSDLADEAAMAFLSGRLNEVIARLNEATRLILGPEVPEGWADADGLRVRFEPAQVSSADPARTSIVIERIERAGDVGDERPLLSLSIRRMGPESVTIEGAKREGTEVFRLVTPARAQTVPLELREAGVYEACWTFEGRPELDRIAGRFAVEEGDRIKSARGSVRWNLGDVDSEIAPVCGTVGFEVAASERIADGEAILRARLSLLDSTSTAGEFARLRFDALSVAASLEIEVTRFAAGEDPYRGYPGHLWRVFVRGEESIPVRLYVPQRLAMTPEESRDEKAEAPAGAPLIIALHGAGGDENLWMDGYAAGAIARLAEEHGFIVASPLAYSFVTSPAPLDALIADLESRYRIDPERIYLIGHSMGGVAVSRLAGQRADRIAAVVAIAGSAAIDPREAPAPSLLYAAARDRIIPATRIERIARRAMEGGAPVELRTVESLGHALVVSAVLPEAVEWLLGHRLARDEESDPVSSGPGVGRPGPREGP